MPAAHSCSAPPPPPPYLGVLNLDCPQCICSALQLALAGRVGTLVGVSAHREALQACMASIVQARGMLRLLAKADTFFFPMATAVVRRNHSQRGTADIALMPALHMQHTRCWSCGWSFHTSVCALLPFCVLTCIAMLAPAQAQAKASLASGTCLA